MEINNTKGKIDAFFRLINLSPTKTNKALFLIIILFLAYGLYRVVEVYESSNRLYIHRLESDIARVTVDNYRLQGEVKDCKAENERKFNKIIEEYEKMFERYKRIEEASSSTKN